MTVDQLTGEIAHGRAIDLIEQVLRDAEAEGVPYEQMLLALVDMVSSLAWKLGGEAKVCAVLMRIDATIDVLKGKRLPLQSETTN